MQWLVRILVWKSISTKIIHKTKTELVVDSRNTLKRKMQLRAYFSFTLVILFLDWIKITLLFCYIFHGINPLNIESLRVVSHIKSTTPSYCLHLAQNMYSCWNGFDIKTHNRAPIQSSTCSTSISYKWNGNKSRFSRYFL